MQPTPLHFTIGTINARIFCDNLEPVTPDEAAGIFPNDAGRVRDALLATPDAVSQYSRNILLLETAGRRMLVDTGLGVLNPQEPGWLLDALLADGITPDSIDTVILTHLHMDHIGGLLDAGNAAVFPSARLLVSRAERDHWMSDAVFSTLNEMRQSVLSGVWRVYPNVEWFEGQHDVAPGVQCVPLPGHTPAQSGLLIESDGARLLHVADALHHVPLQLNLPDAKPRFDALPDVAIATRRALIDRAAAENLTVLGYHFPFPGIGHIRRDAGRFTWQPV